MEYGFVRGVDETVGIRPNGALMTARIRWFPLLVLSFVLVCAQAIAQPAQNRRIRGTIESLDGNVLMVKGRDGQNVKINLADNWAVTAYTKAQVSDIKV